MAEQASDATAIETLTDPDSWSLWINQATLWAEEFLFTEQTLIEVGLILFAALIAWPISHKLRDRFEELSHRDSKFVDCRGQCILVAHDCRGCLAGRRTQYCRLAGPKYSHPR